MAVDKAHDIAINHGIDVSRPLAHEVIALDDVVSVATHGHLASFNNIIDR
jgi:hypothetical protein